MKPNGLLVDRDYIIGEMMRQVWHIRWISTGFFSLLGVYYIAPILTGFAWVKLGFKELNCVSLGITWSSWLLKGSNGFYRISLDSIEFSKVLLSLAGFSWVKQGFTRFYWVIQSFTEFQWV